MSEVLVCTSADVDPGSVGAFSVTTEAGQPKPLAIIQTQAGRWFAMDDRCSHGRFKLSEGFVEEDGIECTRHGSIFDLETGEPLNPPASTPVKTYPVRLDGDSVYVTVS